MNSFYLSQATELSFVTPKHKLHDDHWLLPGTSSAYFCVACAVESLEEQDTLDFHKKKIVTELLEVFLLNNSIWKVLCVKREVCSHLLKLFVRLVCSSRDEDYSSVLLECCLFVIKQTNPEHTANLVVEEVLRIKGFLKNLYLLKLVTSILKVVPVVVHVFVCDWLLQELVKESLAVDHECSLLLWELINITLNAQNADSTITRATCQQVIMAANETLKESRNTETQLVLLECVKSFVELPYLRVVLCEHECSKFTTSAQSTVESLKKTLLSKNQDIQCMAIKCIASIANFTFSSQSENLLTILDVVLEKGISEYIFELLPSADSVVLIELFKCLEKLMCSKRFCKMGHMVYGFTAVLKCVVRSQNCQDQEVFYRGLCLIKLMLQQGVKEKQGSQACSQTELILNMLLNAFQKPQERFKQLSVSCLNTYLQHNDISFNQYEFIYKFLELIFQYIVKDLVFASANVDEVLINFVCSSYEIMLLITGKTSVQLKEFISSVCDSHTIDMPYNEMPNMCQEKRQLLLFVESLYYLCDCYVVPQAVLKFLPTRNMKFQCLFYKCLLNMLVLLPNFAKRLALKIAESSFIQMIYEFKVVASRTSKNMDSILAEILIHLSLSLDYTLNWSNQKEELYNLYCIFNIPITDWNCLLGQQHSSQRLTDTKFVNETRTCMLALLAYSFKAGHSITPLVYIQNQLVKFAVSPLALKTLPTLGKKYFLYLWSQTEMILLNEVDDVASINIISMFHDEADTLMPILLICKLFFIWMLKNDVSLDLQKQVMERYFTNCLQDNTEEFEKFILCVKSHGQSVKVLEIVLHLGSSCINQLILNGLFIIFQSLVQDMEPDVHAHLKKFIHKLFLTNENVISNGNVTLLYKCLNAIEIICRSDVDEDDLKLLCRAIVLAVENHVPTLQLELINFMYVLVTKALVTQDVKVTTILVEKIDLFLQFEKLVFTNENSFSNAKSSQTLEKVNSATFLFISELIHSIHLFAPHHNITIRCSKSLLVQSIACSIGPTHQISVLNFWKRFFEQKCSTSLIQLINENAEPCRITSQDIHRIFIILQNLYYNQEISICEGAVEVICALVQNISSEEIIKQSWNKTLLQIVFERLNLDEVHPPSVSLLLMFLKQKCISDNICLISIAAKLIKQCTTHGSNYCEEVLVLVQIVLNEHSKLMTYTQLKEIKSDIRVISETINQSDLNLTKLNYVSFNGVLFTHVNTTRNVDIIQRIAGVKNAIDKQMNLWEGETDSGEETEE